MWIKMCIIVFDLSLQYQMVFGGLCETNVSNIKTLKIIIIIQLIFIKFIMCIKVAFTNIWVYSLCEQYLHYSTT